MRVGSCASLKVLLWLSDAKWVLIEVLLEGVCGHRVGLAGGYNGDVLT